RMRDYEHFRPYFFSTHLRFSYGTDRGRPRDEWQGRVAALRADAMVGTLERYGFAGIILNRDGFADGGEEVLEGLRAAGRPASETVDDLVLVPLRPAPEPELPRADVTPVGQ